MPAIFHVPADEEEGPEMTVFDTVVERVGIGDVPALLLESLDAARYLTRSQVSELRDALTEWLGDDDSGPTRDDYERMDMGR